MGLAFRSATGEAINESATSTLTTIPPSPQIPTHARRPLPQRQPVSQARVVDNSDQAACEFDAFSDPLRRELAPASQLEDFLVEQVILAAWRLHLISKHEIDAARGGFTLSHRSRETLRAESSLETGFVLLEAARRARQPRWGRAEQAASKVTISPSDEDDYGDDTRDFSNEWPVMPATRQVTPDRERPDQDDDRDDETEVAAQWNERLIFDDNVSDSSPVVKGTWVTVSHVVSLVVDGWTWSDILRTHPELTEDDIRACLAYTVAQDNSGAY
jgi:uncharacterized protein (DUF433 family)